MDQSPPRHPPTAFSDFVALFLESMNLHMVHEAVAFPKLVRTPGQVPASLMTALDLSPAVLAQSTDISVEELERLVTGQQDFSRAQTHLLAERLHVDPLIFV